LRMRNGSASARCISSHSLNAQKKALTVTAGQSQKKKALTAGP